MKINRGLSPIIVITYNHKVLFDFFPLPGHVNWNNNEARTFQMETEVFEKMAEFANPANNVITNGKVSQVDFDAFLQLFNAVEENAATTGEYGFEENTPGDSFKIRLLEAALAKMGFDINLTDPNKPEFKGFDKGIASANRNGSFCVDGKPLTQTDYPVTILPTSC